MQLNSLIVAIAFIGVFIFGDETNIRAQQPSPPPAAAPHFAVVMESRGIKATFVDTPVVGGNYGQDIPEGNVLKGKKWLQVSFQFKAEDPLKGYIEELKFKISIEGVQLTTNESVGKPVLLTGETTFIDIPAKPGGTVNTGYFYVHPAVIERLAGLADTDRVYRDGSFIGERKNKSNKNIRIQALVNDQPIPLDLEGKNTYVDLLQDLPNWVDQCVPLPDRVLAKNNSPWALAWMDSTPLIKPLKPPGEGPGAN